MTQAERSLLFYVLDAIRIAPAKCVTVCGLVDQEERSAEFKRHLSTLRGATSPEDARRLVEVVRTEIL